MQLEKLRAELASIEALGTIEARPSVLPKLDISDVVHDSRQAQPGTLFCAVPGLAVDGHDFVDGATSAGAPALLVEHWVDNDRPQLKVANVRRSMPFAAAAVHGYPSESLVVFGITGTNGKTTTTQMLASIMASAGHTCAVIGTLGGVHTTPEAPELQRRLRDYVAEGIDVLALEVSSHAIDQHRIDGTRFAVAAFSNLTPDHLDYHHDMESYFDAKKQLFDGRANIELINVDDPWGQRLHADRPDARAVSLSDVHVVEQTLDGSTFVWRDQRVQIGLPGLMNVSNALLAAEAAVALGLNVADIATGLSDAGLVPGRMERVPATATGPTVIVDYSHTPDSIERALATVRQVAPGGAVSIVFGCGGDRDRTKRPLMGKAAEEGADRVYVTSDNPRSEEPLLIIADALAGMTEPNDVYVEPDRRAAIERAIIEAGPHDVVLIAGKGHEKTQTIGSDVLPYNDVRVAQDFLEANDS